MMLVKRYLGSILPFAVVIVLTVLSLRFVPLSAQPDSSKDYSLGFSDHEEVNKLSEQIDAGEKPRATSLLLRFACVDYIRNEELGEFGWLDRQKKLEKVIRYLVKNGASFYVPRVTTKGKSVGQMNQWDHPLEFAVNYHSLSLYRLLKELGVNPKTSSGSDPTLFFALDFHLARQELGSGGRILMVDELVKDGVDINRQDERGRTVLHYIVNVYFTQTLRTLLDDGAKVNIRDKDGLTPLDYVRSKEAYDLLVAAGAKHGDKL